MHTQPSRVPRCLLVQVIDPHTHRDDALNNFEELDLLVETFGAVVLERTVQHKPNPHLGTYIGPGKVEEVKELIIKKHIDIVILNDVTTAGQIFRLEKTLWEVNPDIRVWDRADLILSLFDQHASSKEAKLQIELARLSHLGPRIYGMGGTYFSRQGGGIGTRGLGETNIERMRRHIKNNIRKLQKELSEVAARRLSTIHERRRNGAFSVALVGYTNAGKTSLFNTLTGKTKEIKNALFTTLDSTAGKLAGTDSSRHILVTDTIGFLEGLPPFLIDAFRSTLMESIHADLLIHVVDGADTRMNKKIRIVEDILRELGVNVSPLLVFNKLDQIPEKQLEEMYTTYQASHPHYISVKAGAGIKALRTAIIQRATAQIDF